MLQQLAVPVCSRMIGGTWQRGCRGASICVCDGVHAHRRLFRGLVGRGDRRGGPGAANTKWTQAVRCLGYAHVPPIPVDKLKGGTNSTKLRTQPPAAVTKDGRDLKMWLKRVLTANQHAGWKVGLLFRNRTGN